MKKILIIMLSLLMFCGKENAWADTCGVSLIPAFTSNQAVQLCKVFGSAVNHSLIPSSDNTYDVGSSSFGWRTGYFDTSVITPLLNATASQVISVDADAQRLFTFDASSDTAHILTYGDAGVTALQTLLIASSTADADDDGLTVVCAGGAESSARGACIRLRGEEFSGGGDAFITAGDSDAVNILSGSTTAGSFDTTGLVMATTGLTLAVDSGTAATACKGTATANGTTAVTVSTTCAATGANIIIARTSAPSGTAICWTDTIVNATSFNLDCSGAETGTFSWWILKEG